MLCTLFFIKAQYQFKIIARHIPGALNTLADYLSYIELEKFHTNHHTANRYPSCTPVNLLQWLLDPRMDWMSDHWTQQFSTFINKE